MVSQTLSVVLLPNDVSQDVVRDPEYESRLINNHQWRKKGTRERQVTR